MQNSWSRARCVSLCVVCVRVCVQSSARECEKSIVRDAAAWRKQVDCLQGTIQPRTYLGKNTAEMETFQVHMRIEELGDLLTPNNKRINAVSDLFTYFAA